MKGSLTRIIDNIRNVSGKIYIKRYISKERYKFIKVLDISNILVCIGAFTTLETYKIKTITYEYKGLNILDIHQRTYYLEI